MNNDTFDAQNELRELQFAIEQKLLNEKAKQADHCPAKLLKERAMLPHEWDVDEISRLIKCKHCGAEGMPRSGGWSSRSRAGQ